MNESLPRDDAPQRRPAESRGVGSKLMRLLNRRPRPIGPDEPFPVPEPTLAFGMMSKSDVHADPPQELVEQEEADAKRVVDAYEAGPSTPDVVPELVPALPGADERPNRPSDKLSGKERKRALAELKRAHLLPSQGQEAQSEQGREEDLLQEQEAVLLDAYVMSGGTVPNRVVGTAEVPTEVPDATKTAGGRETLRILHRVLEIQLDIPDEDRAPDPYPEPPGNGSGTGGDKDSD